MTLFLRNIFFVIILPGSVTVMIPTSFSGATLRLSVSASRRLGDLSI
jgi:hypothetical protein